jgi:hypothetical protein
MQVIPRVNRYRKRASGFMWGNFTPDINSLYYPEQGDSDSRCTELPCNHKNLHIQETLVRLYLREPVTEDACFMNTLRTVLLGEGYRQLTPESIFRW